MLQDIFTPAFVVQALILTLIWLFIAWKIYPYHVLEKIRWFFTSKEEVEKAVKVSHELLIGALIPAIKKVFQGYYGGVLGRMGRAANQLTSEIDGAVSPQMNPIEQIMLQRMAEWAQSEDPIKQAMGLGGMHLYQQRLLKEQAQVPGPVPPGGQVVDPSALDHTGTTEVVNGPSQDMSVLQGQPSQEVGVPQVQAGAQEGQMAQVSDTHGTKEEETVP